jgi:hypothetical protein
MGGDAGSICNGIVNIDTGGKVFRRGEFVMGCCGLARITDVVRYVFSPPPIKGELTAYMARKFVPALARCFEKAGVQPPKDDEGAAYAGSVLVGVRGRLFLVDGGLALTNESDGYNAVGSGSEVALGALFASRGQKPEERVEVALKAAERWCDSVRGPFTVEHLPSPRRTIKRTSRMKTHVPVKQIREAVKAVTSRKK